MNSKLLMLLVLGAVALGGCSMMNRRPPIQTEPQVDLNRFMGDWYVIANIPTRLEKEAYNAVESYKLDKDGTIAVTFTFRKGAFDGEPKEYNPRGFVRDKQTNAVWGMRFIWPFKADYRIMYVDDHYSQTVVGREKRDFVWIMARRPSIPESDYQRLVAMIAKEGYDTSKIQKVPQRWDSRTV